jgi:large subunit ribosomal protein L10
MPTAIKEQEVALLTEHLAKSKSVVLSEYAGMTVDSITRLRRKCRENNIQFRVTKNTLLQRALNARGLTSLDEHLKGPLAVAFSEDEVVAAKVLSDFAKENQLPKVTAGLVDGKFMSAAQLGVLAKLPGKQELLTQLVFTLHAPARNLVVVLSAPARNLAMVLGQIAKQKESAA